MKTVLPLLNFFTGRMLTHAMHVIKVLEPVLCDTYITGEDEHAYFEPNLVS